MNINEYKVYTFYAFRLTKKVFVLFNLVSAYNSSLKKKQNIKYSNLALDFAL